MIDDTSPMTPTRLLGTAMMEALDRLGFMVVRKPMLLDTLPPAIREAVRLAAEGKQTKVIAYELGKHEGTIKVQLSEAYKRLGVRNRAGLLHKLQGA